MNFSEFCIGSFSSVPMNFWVFLSIPSTGGRDLAPYCKKWKNKIFFRGRKFWSKLHFSHFEWRFFIIFSSMLRKFWVSEARWGRILLESEERIEKYVDTDENEMKENFDFLKFSIFWKKFFLVGVVQNVAGRPPVSFWSAGDVVGGHKQQQQQQQQQHSCKISKRKNFLCSRRRKCVFGGSVSGALKTHSLVEFCFRFV